MCQDLLDGMEIIIVVIRIRDSPFQQRQTPSRAGIPKDRTPQLKSDAEGKLLVFS
jgi:hypothetical protein